MRLHETKILHQTENVGKAMWEISERRIFDSREKKCIDFWMYSWEEGDPVKDFTSLAHIEGFWLLQDFDFRVFTKSHFPSDAREAVVLLSQPEPKWKGCRRFQGVRESSYGRGIVPCVQRSCAVLPGWVCVWAAPRGCSMDTGGVHRRYDFHHHTHSPIGRAYIWRDEHFLFSQSSKKRKGLLLCRLHFSASKLSQNDLVLWPFA